MPEDRYQPLPPITRLPALLWARMGTTAHALAMLAALGAGAVVVALAPRIADTKSDNDSRERREAAEVKARQIRELRELQRPRTGRTGRTGDPRPDLERLITTDARSRPDAGRVLRTDCKAIRGGGGRFSCTAVTSDLPGGDVSRAGSVGYPFRALANGRRLTWCRIAGRPAEGALELRAVSATPRACGG